MLTVAALPDVEVAHVSLAVLRAWLRGGGRGRGRARVPVRTSPSPNPSPHPNQDRAAAQLVHAELQQQVGALQSEARYISPGRCREM